MTLILIKMSNYNEFKINIYPDYIKIKITQIKSYEKYFLNVRKIKIHEPIIISLLKSINCSKDDKSDNYDCEITEYSLKLCMTDFF